MKIFKVKIDNNPGAWKTVGEDTVVLVPADTAEEAIEMVKNGWSCGFKYVNNKYVDEYGYGCGNNYMNDRSQLSASEIKFQGIGEITTVREAKLKRINKNEKD